MRSTGPPLAHTRSAVYGALLLVEFSTRPIKRSKLRSMLERMDARWSADCPGHSALVAGALMSSLTTFLAWAPSKMECCSLINGCQCSHIHDFSPKREPSQRGRS